MMKYCKLTRSSVCALSQQDEDGQCPACYALAVHAHPWQRLW